MEKTKMVRVIIAVSLIVLSLFFVSGALAATENECINGGGHVAAGSGCKFCIGGKFDLSEIRDVGKNDAAHSGSEQKTSDRSSSQSGSGTSARTPTDSRM